MIRPASRPLASCQSLVYSFPRDAMWRSWAASCLRCFFIPVPLARRAVVEVLLFLFTEPPFSPQEVHVRGP